MKIIGKTKDGFILEASADEVANLTGAYSQFHDNPKPCVGGEIQVAPMFHQLYKLANHRRQVADVRDTLRNMADNLEPVETLVESLAQEEAATA